MWRDGGDSNVGGVLSSHGVGLDETVELWKKESTGLLLPWKPVLRAGGTSHCQARITVRDRAGNEISTSLESLPVSTGGLIYLVGFKSLLDAEEHIDEVILPRLSSEWKR